MDKKLINEDISNMKYLFGYKAGVVISEQDYDYTTDDYLDTELDEIKRPERIVKHSDTGKIVGTHKRGVGYHPSEHGEELGFEYHPTDIPYGTKFGGTEVGDFDYEEGDFNEEISEDKDDDLLEQEESIDQTFDFFMNEEKGDNNF